MLCTLQLETKGNCRSGIILAMSQLSYKLNGLEREMSILMYFPVGAWHFVILNISGLCVYMCVWKQSAENLCSTSSDHQHV